MNKPEPISDEWIEQSLDEMFAGWLMDEADEMCQAKAIRHLARAIEAERDAAWAGQLGELQAEAKELDALRGKLADILSRTAIALRGPEPELTLWGWYDLPERVEALKARLEEAERDAKRWRWWRRNFAALCSMQCAQIAGLDLSRTFVDSPMKMDAVTDAAITKERP